MNHFLRTAPTSRVLGAVLGLVVAIVAGTTIAIAAQGSGPVPRHEPLSRAIHQALGAHTPQGIFARITFTNGLVNSSEIQGHDPLLNGGSGRLWITGHRLRLEIQGDNGDAQIVVNGRSFWAYDPAFKTVYRTTLPASLSGSPKHRARHGHDALPSLAQIQSGLNRLARHLHLSGAMPTDVGGQAAYSVRVSPRQNNSLLGGAELAWDAVRGVPLRIGLYARGNPSPVLQLAATDISFGPQPSSIFNISPPSGTHVVSLSTQTAGGHTRSESTAHHKAVTGVKAVAGHLPFTLDAPTSLAGRSRAGVRLIGASSHRGALLFYGHGLGTVVVLEQPAGHTHAVQAPSGGDQPGLSLPTVSIRGASAQQLETALGTVLRFTRGGVAYTVLGSVPAGTADAVARGL